MNTIDIYSVPEDHRKVVERLTRDLVKAAKTLSAKEARFLVDAYYMIQDNRIMAGNQIAALTRVTETHPNEEPNEVLRWLLDQQGILENQIKRALDSYSDSDPLGEWARGVIGIGPVIAAGLLAHIDIEKAPTAGHIWRFAGLDPTSRWDKGQKRPWNAGLKTLCWKIGESFVKVSGNPKAIYGQLYKQRKELEMERNERHKFAEQAKAKLEKYRIGKDTDAYKAYSDGRLPPAHIHARAKRWAIKIFLSHYHAQAYRLKYGKEPPAPYAIAIQGHAHKI